VRNRCLNKLIQTALEDKVFPGGVLLASKKGEVLVREVFGRTDVNAKTLVSPDTIYDLASLTKPLATTLAVMHLVDTSSLRLGQTLGDLLPACTGTDKAGITVEHLLAHQSGLPDYRPFWKELSGQTPLEKDAVLKERLIQEPLENPIGSSTLYSDLGFMFLRWVVEQVSGMEMHRLVEKEIYAPLGIKDLFFPVAQEPALNRFAATEMCPWRNRLIQGVVHDENAYALGGVDGHAGLFGTASGVHDLLQEMLSAYFGRSHKGVLPQGLMQSFLNYDTGGERALGFDRPTSPGSSSGRYFSKNSVGHLGFTGTSFWMDLEQAIIVILLTNRIHPTRENDKIRIFRPVIHDAVMQFLM
jgi:CubicO group peptidase (beta-lactamase class C family)